MYLLAGRKGPQMREEEKQAGAELCQAQAQVSLNLKVEFQIWVLPEKKYISLYFADFQLLRSSPMEVVFHGGRLPWRSSSMEVVFLLSKIFQIV